MHAKLGLAPLALLFFLAGPSLAQDMDELMRINAIVTACERLEHDYAIYRDRGDGEAFANLFTEDGEWGHPTTVLKGREAIRKYIESSSGGPPEARLQLQTTIQITPVDDTTATGISYAIILNGDRPVGPGDPPIQMEGITSVNVYHTEFALTSDGWRISRMELEPVFRGPGLA